MPIPPPNQTQLNALTQMLAALNAASPLSSSSAGAKVYEGYLAVTLAEAICQEAGNRTGGIVQLELANDHNQHPPNVFVLRGGPGSLTTTPVQNIGLAPTHLVFTINGERYEVHCGVRWLDAMAQHISHEADIAIINAPLGQRGTNIGPIYWELLLTVECKFWTQAVSLGTARNAESFVWFMKPDNHVLVSKSSVNNTVANFVGHYMNTTSYYSDIVTHGSGAQQTFVANVSTAFCDSIGI